MGKKKKNKKEKIDINQQQQQAFKSTSSPFQGLLQNASLSHLIETPSSLDSTSTNESSAHTNTTKQSPLDLTVIIDQLSHVQISHSRAKRSGKTVSIIRCKQTTFDVKTHQKLTKALGQFLACRAWVEEGMIYVQGDQRQRIHSWMQKHTVHSVIVTT